MKTSKLRESGNVNSNADDNGDVVLGPWKPLPPELLETLLRKGADDARELDRAIRSQFEPTTADLAFRLR